MSLQDLRTLYHIALSPIRGATHQERLESFYAGQAKDYDAFRKRLLHGRLDLFERLDFPENGVWVDMGGGTGQNLECVADKLSLLKKAYVVDLCPSLLALARDRIASMGADNAEAIEADACSFVPPEGGADLVTFSYSLTMIPDWFRALENAFSFLKPNGKIAVVDFYVARKYPDESLARHSAFTRRFWPMWFYNDNVFLSPDHLPWLLSHTRQLHLSENFAPVPYVPLIKTPYYAYIGEKS